MPPIIGPKDRTVSGGLFGAALSGAATFLFGAAAVRTFVYGHGASDEKNEDGQGEVA
jgi:hypothetical protein